MEKWLLLSRMDSFPYYYRLVLLGVSKSPFFLLFSFFGSYKIKPAYIPPNIRYLTNTFDI